MQNVPFRRARAFGTACWQIVLLCVMQRQPGIGSQGGSDPLAVRHSSRLAALPAAERESERVSAFLGPFPALSLDVRQFHTFRWCQGVLPTQTSCVPSRRNSPNLGEKWRWGCVPVPYAHGSIPQLGCFSKACDGLMSGGLYRQISQKQCAY